MMENLFCFKADYRDGRVYVGGKVYAAGLFATYLLNQYYLNDTAARIAVFSDDVNYNVIRQLENGYLNISEFVSTGRNVLEAMKSLPKLHPFDTLDNSAITDRVTNLFTEENGERMLSTYSGKYRSRSRRNISPSKRTRQAAEKPLPAVLPLTDISLSC